MAPGSLGPLAAQTITFWPTSTPSRVLDFYDLGGALWAFRTITSVAVDYSGDGTPTHTWVLADHPWLVPVPALTGERPARALRIHESHRDAVETVWPCDPGTAAITGEPGPAATDLQIVDLVCHVARAVRDGHLGGAAAVMQALDSGVNVDPAMSKVWWRIQREHSAGRLADFGLLGSAGGRR